MISAPQQDIISGTTEPEINQYKNHRGSPLILKILFGCVVLVLLGLVVFKLQGLMRGVEGDKDDDGRLLEVVNASSRRRQDLGTQTNSIEIRPDLSVSDVQTPDNPPRTAPTVAYVFAKYLSIPLQSAGPSANPVQPAPGSSTSKASAVTAETAASGGSKVEVISLDPNLFIEENTYIPCALQTRFVSDIAGNISCVISQDVYSANSHTKLIDKGTKAFGSYRAGTLKHGQGRLFVIWTQLRTPDFKKISLVNTQVVGQLGEAGIEGWIDTHFWERFGNALMLSLVQDVAAAVAKTSGDKNRTTDYTENSRESIAKMANTTLENSINIPPTLYKNQGDVIGILVGEDIDFSGVYTLRARP